MKRSKESLTFKLCRGIPRGHHLGFSLRDDVRNRFVLCVNAQHKSASEVLRGLVERYVEDQELTGGIQKKESNIIKQKTRKEKTK